MAADAETVSSRADAAAAAMGSTAAADLRRTGESVGDDKKLPIEELFEANPDPDSSLRADVAETTPLTFLVFRPLKLKRRPGVELALPVLLVLKLVPSNGLPPAI